MRTFQIRTRGQTALFAGIWLFAFVPFFALGALQTTGYGTATAHSAALNNYAPLVQWANAHLALVLAFPIIQVIPLILVIRLPEMLQSIIDENKGTVGRWCGVAALTLVALMTIINMLQLVAAARGYTPASASTIGANFRTAAIIDSLIADILGSLLFTVWLIAVNVPLVRLGGFERVIGIVGVLNAAMFAATAGLVLYNPQQPQGPLAGTAFAVFGLWLFLIGQLLTRRAPALGEPIAGEAETAVGE
jgi:hypothetical protein